MNKPYYIEYILNNFTVTDYLKSKGHVPEREYADKDAYICPIHEGDTDPSFYVFKNNDYEAVKCFGCGFHGDIINVYAEIEEVALQKSILHFAKGLNIDEETVLRDIARCILDNYNKKEEKLENIIIKISVFCHQYLLSSNNKEKEFDFLDKMYEQIDKFIISMDTNNIKEIYNYVFDKIIPSRKKT